MATKGKVETIGRERVLVYGGGYETGLREGAKRERARIRRAILKLRVRYEDQPSPLQAYVLDQALIVIAPKRGKGKK